MTSNCTITPEKPKAKSPQTPEVAARNTRLGGIVAIAFCAFLLVFGVFLIISGRKFNDADTIDFGALIRVGFGVIITLFSLLFIAVGLSVLNDNSNEAATAARAVQASTDENRNRAIESITKRLAEVNTPEDLCATMNEVLAELRVMSALAPQSSSWLAFDGLAKRYHERAQTEAQVWFVFSIIGAVGAFGFIVYAAWSNQGTALDTALRTVPGGTLGAVSGLFFRQADVTRRRSTDLFDRLREDGQRAAALPMLESIEDDQLRDGIKAQLALRMSGADANLTEIAALLTKPKPAPIATTLPTQVP